MVGKKITFQVDPMIEPDTPWQMIEDVRLLAILMPSLKSTKTF